MRVLMVGATGVVGRPAVAALVAASHDVTGLTRSPAKAAALRAAGATPVDFDLTMLMRSQRIANRRFRGATAWAPRFPSAREGWRAIAETWAAAAARA